MLQLHYVRLWRRLAMLASMLGNPMQHLASNGSKTLTTPRQVPFVSSLVFSVPYLSQRCRPLIETWLSSSLRYTMDNCSPESFSKVVVSFVGEHDYL
jgi:hypothetical protein